MSTVRKPQRRPPAPRDDPFRLGWRFVWRTSTNGRRRQVQVGLTEEDVLFPEEGDFIVNNDPHWLDCRYLADVFTAALAAVLGAMVVGDLRIAWGVGGVRPMGPDVAVIFNVRERRRWGTFHVVEEGTRPELVLEVTSPTTRRNDLTRKRQLYYRAGVPFYIIVDELPEYSGPRRLRLMGYRRGRYGYERIQPDEQGRLWLEPVGVWLSTEDGRVVCYDRDGQRILTAVEERQARSAAEARVRQLEAELRRRNGR